MAGLFPSGDQGETLINRRVTFPASVSADFNAPKGQTSPQQ
jgi:hypothetical protein